MLNFITIKAHAGIVIGFESPATEYIQRSLNLNQLLIDHPSSTFMHTMPDNSLAGNGIFTGDILIVDQALTVRDNDIVMANLNGDVVIRIFDKHLHCLAASFKGFNSHPLSLDDEFNVTGVVICSIRLHRPLKKTLPDGLFPTGALPRFDYSLDTLLIDNAPATYIGIADGNSMVGNGIMSGDLLMIDRSALAQDLDIIVANLNGTFVVKRINKEKRCLTSSGKGALPYFLKDDDIFQVEGTVTRSIRLHRSLGMAL
jgi:DNA polymerase V